MNNAVYGKTMENVRKDRDIKLATTGRTRNCLVSEPNYHSIKFLTEHLLAIEIKKAQILMNTPPNFRLSALELSKILMYQFWYDYLKPKYDEKSKLYYMHTDSFIVYTKTVDIYKDITKDVENRFDTSNYELDRPLPKGENEEVIGLIKDELGEKIMLD